MNLINMSSDLELYLRKTKTPEWNIEVINYIINEKDGVFSEKGPLFLKKDIPKEVFNFLLEKFTLAFHQRITRVEITFGERFICFNRSGSKFLTQRDGKLYIRSLEPFMIKSITEYHDCSSASFDENDNLVYSISRNTVYCNGEIKNEERHVGDVYYLKSGEGFIYSSNTMLVKTGPLRKETAFGILGILSFSVNDDETIIAMSEVGGYLSIVSLSSLNLIKGVQYSSTTNLFKVKISGERILAYSIGDIKIYDLKTLTCLRTIGDYHIISVDIFNSGENIIFSYESYVRIEGTVSRDFIQTFPIENGSKVHVFPDGKRLITSSARNHINVYTI